MRPPSSFILHPSIRPTLTGFDSFTLCQGPLFADGFESGDTTAWSGAAP
jgi:hypothetical protein